MIDEHTSSLPILVLLGTLVFLYHFGVGLYLALDLEPSPAFEFLYRAAFLCGVVWWLQAEARRFNLKSAYCPGLLVRIVWVVIIPYHLFKTRGAKGLIPLLALLGNLSIAYMLAQIVARVL